MSQLLADILGWIGSILLVVAYGLNSINRMNSQSLAYQSMNIVGSALLIVNTIYYGAYPSSALNVVWMLIGLVYIGKLIKKPSLD